MSHYLSPFAYDVWCAQMEIFLKVGLPFLVIWFTIRFTYIYHKYKKDLERVNKNG